MVDKKVLTRNLRLIENYPYDGVIYCDSSTLFTDAVGLFHFRWYFAEHYLLCADERVGRSFP